MSMLKQLGLAALAASFIAGSAGASYAEGDIHGTSGGTSGALSTSSALQSDWEATHGNAFVSTGAPSANASAYGSSREDGLDRPHKQVRSKMKHYN
jgi:hypothetical protein